ncbi:MAG: twin-arginine translocation pathway signal protein, partial [Campylobacteraceae bacterium]|nr:twin-arginine translocation pathway signal protein [Campylobacteraceae bacterium]
MNEERRNFIKISSTTAGVMLVPGIFTGCFTKSEKTQKEASAWDGHKYDEKDIRIIVLSYAILAPNPHNKQPWLIELKDESNFDLYVDTNRTLPHTDPPFRQIHIGQGTFLENLNLAALNFGYKAIIKYFPHGEYSNSVIEHKPIASIQLIQNKSIPKDPLFDKILVRQSNKRAYDNEKAPLQQLKILQTKIQEELENGFSLNITSKTEHMEKLRDIMVNGMKIESINHDRDLETIKMFR